MADDNLRVRCAECGRYSEVMAPTEPTDEVAWKCPQQGDNGDLCGAVNIIRS